MTIKAYIYEKRELQEKTHSIIENDTEENYIDLKDYLESHNYCENKDDFKALLYLLANISNNHHRFSNFFQIFQKIFLIIQNDIKIFFSNLEIFNFFKGNKKMILLLIQNNLLKIDSYISEEIIKSETDRFFFIQKSNLFLKKKQ